MGIMKDTMDKYHTMLDLLASVITEVEDIGEIEIPTYLKIREFFKEEEPIPEIMQEKVDAWNDRS